MWFVELIRNVRIPWAHIAVFVNQDLNLDQPSARAVSLTVVLFYHIISYRFYNSSLLIDIHYLIMLDLFQVKFTDPRVSTSMNAQWEFVNKGAPIYGVHFVAIADLDIDLHLMVS